MIQFVNIAVVCRSISKKINLMLKDVHDLIYMTRVQAHKKNRFFPSNQFCYFKVKQDKPIIFILASRNLVETNFHLP